ncbi:MAG: exodeoxyribonuclease VII large subunit [Bacteroidetes bacterium RIFCSPLOWO2_02_FULL_36_8]|nr:MAG: exodeoxyribonuclease VII large subunit [Bacteroidetes bacterium RIFCSPLOWO2_02_FULL_36_8]OFY70358.1 MAG: exodeoxyribonuclease VII large subunit [Bacteroidetes bacterium RIFCSPLOWO2_12_FULL_37_12]
MEIKPEFIRLSELNQQIQDLLYSVYDCYFWVVAEIASLKNSPRGHCYIELVEKEGDSVLAQMRANIWVDKYRILNQEFLSTTGSVLEKGMKILFCASVDFHPVYGLSLTITGIEPSFTLGEKARKKMEIMSRLAQEGFLDKNKNLQFPIIPQRVAVISSISAAGYGDFINHLTSNPHRFKFSVKLFNAVMQGEKSAFSIIKQLSLINQGNKNVDLVVILRGGGSQMDLDCFDNYELAKIVAGMRIPVISAIGHHRDDTVLDHVSHTRVKTPTAAADLLIEKFLNYEVGLMDILSKIKNETLSFVQQEKNRIFRIESELTQLFSETLRDSQSKLKELNYQIRIKPIQKVFDYQKSLQIIFSNLSHTVERNVKEKNDAFKLICKNLPVKFKEQLGRISQKIINGENTIRMLDPQKVLKRGYSITTSNGKIIKDIRTISPGEMIDTKIFSGNIQSRVENKIERLK